MTSTSNNPALAVIQAVIEDTSHIFEGDQDIVLFLRLWYQGEFDSCREHWPSLPDEVYIDADPLFKAKESTPPENSTSLTLSAEAFDELNQAFSESPLSENKKLQSFLAQDRRWA